MCSIVVITGKGLYSRGGGDTGGGVGGGELRNERNAKCESALSV